MFILSTGCTCCRGDGIKMVVKEHGCVVEYYRKYSKVPVYGVDSFEYEYWGKYNKSY